jgi:signal transduction histidine kinase/CheY-like chemotaxis protein
MSLSNSIISSSTSVDEILKMASEQPLEAALQLENLLLENKKTFSEAEQANIHFRLAEIYREQKNQHRELRHLKECVDFYVNIGDSERSYLINIHLGRILTNLGKYASALNHLMKALKISEYLSNYHWQIRVHNNLGLLYGRMFNYESSIKHFLESKNIFKLHQIKDDLLLMRTNCFLGNAYTRMKLFDRAADHFTSAYSSLRNDFSTADYLMPIRGMAYLFLEQNYLEKAKIYLDKAEQFLNDKTDNFSKLNLLMLKGSYYKHLGEHHHSIKIFTEVIELSKKENVFVFELEALHEIANSYETLNDFKNGLDFWKKFYELKTKNVTEENMQSFQALEIQHKFEEAIKAKSMAEEASEMKEHIMLNLSHEIRTPMNSIHGFLQLLQKTKLDDEQHEYVSVIGKSTLTILDIIEDVLQLTKISRGSEQLEEIDFNLHQLFEEIKQILSLKCMQNKVEFTFSIDEKIPTTLLGDASHLKQILINLCNNAVKFSNQSEVKLEATFIGYRAPVYDLQFKVIDYGIGISPEHLPQIFETFSPASFQTNKLFGGTGLGLNICKKLTEMMHGKLYVESELKKGSTFFVELPIKRSNQVEKPKKEKAIDEKLLTQEIKILLVEDNLFNQKLASKSISIALPKSTVEIADNGMIAIEMLGKNSYDIVLMDIQMPVMNGYETAEFIRKKMPAPVNQIPILAQTANVMKSEMERCFEAGMNDYISKPFAINILIEKIQNLILRK